MDKGKSLEKFAAEIGLGERKGYLSQIENGKRNITPLTAKRLAEKMDLPDEVLDPMLAPSGDVAEPEDTEVAQRLEQQEQMIAQLAAKAHEKSDDMLRDEGITEKAIIRLAQRIAAETDDVGQAWLELQNAMDIAVRVQAEGAVGSKHQGFVDEVLASATELAREGEYATAGAAIDDALEQAAAQQARLLAKGVDVALLDRDTARAAELLVRKADLDAGGVAGFEDLRALLYYFYVAGRDKGRNLDCVLAIDLAQILLGRTANAKQRGTVKNDLGLALQILGERENGDDKLEQAVAAHEAALGELTRDKFPLEWAAIQMNLGNALLAFGQRKTGIGKLEKAVAAYRAALNEWIREKSPLEWATTQMNLGSALLVIGERESGTDRLEQAVKAYNAALEERTREKEPVGWATTQKNLGNALQIIGERESGTERLEQAANAYEAALEERTREKVPWGWAMTQQGISGLEIAFFRKSSDPLHLDRARAHAMNARTVYVDAGATYYIKRIDERLAEIASLQGELR